MPLSTFLDGRTPTQLRGLAWLALSETGYVLRGTVTGDSGGGGTTSFGTAGTFPCRIDPLGGNEGVAGDRLSDRSTHLLTLPPNADVGAPDRFKIADVGSFEITAVRSATNELARMIEAVAL